MDYFSKKVKGVSSLLSAPFHKVKMLLEKNKVYPDIIPFIIIGLLAKGSHLIGEINFIKPYLNQITKHGQISLKYIILFQETVVGTKIIFDIIYFYILISLAGLFFKLYRIFNRMEQMLIVPLSNFIMSVVVAYTGFLFGLSLTGGVNTMNFSPDLLIIVFSPLGSCIVINYIMYLLGEKKSGETLRRFLPVWMQHRFDGLFLIFLSGAFLSYGRTAIEFLKSLSN